MFGDLRQTLGAFLRVLDLELCQYSIHMAKPLFPSSRVTDFRSIQQPAAVARIAMLGDHLVRRFRTAAAAHCHGHFHPFAFLALNTNLADRLQALGNFIIGRSLSADSP